MRGAAGLAATIQTATPTSGVHGKTLPGAGIPPGDPFQNVSENRSPQQGRSENFLENQSSQPAPLSPAPAITGTVLPAKREITLPDGRKIAAGLYVPEFAEMMIDYFEAAEKFRTVYETVTWKNGEVREIEKQVPNAPPSPREFARSIGVTHKRLKAWAKKFPEFKDAYEQCEEIYKDFLIENGLLGHYPAQFATFVAKNETDMKDKNINENFNFNVTDFLNNLERGKIGDDDIEE